MLLNCGAGEDSWESLGLQEIKPVNPKGNNNNNWKDWCWSQSSNSLATWCEELTCWKRPWCWERLKAGEGDNRGWDGWMASPTQWTWVWASSGGWWRTEEDEAAHLFSLLRERWEGRLTYLCNSLLWGWNWHPLHRSRASPGHSSSYPLPSSVL